jgi:hypothetical protein
LLCTLRKIGWYFFRTLQSEGVMRCGRKTGMRVEFVVAEEEWIAAA